MGIGTLGGVISTKSYVSRKLPPRTHVQKFNAYGSQLTENSRKPYGNLLKSVHRTVIRDHRCTKTPGECVTSGTAILPIILNNHQNRILHLLGMEKIF